MKNIVGIILAVLVSLSALLSIAGIWGLVNGDTIGKLLTTFVVIGFTTLAASRINNSFFDNKKG